MKFLKYYHKWASGYDKPGYKIIHDSDPLMVEEMVHELNDENAWSDKYRGLNYEVIDNPPKTWLIEKINSIESSIVYQNKLLIELNKLVNKNNED